MPVLKKEDLLQIESILYKPKEQELAARKIARVNTNFLPYAREIGYDVYSRTGKAKIVAAGAGANDIPFVGEDMTRVTQPAIDIVTGVRYSFDELEAMQAKRSLGKGAVFALDTTRVESARRYVAEQEDKICFVGSTDYGIDGILNVSGTTTEDVAQGATGATAAEKRLWANKTALEILTDIHKAKQTIEKDGYFKAKTLVLPPSSKLRMLKPFNELSMLTLMEWFKQNGLFFDSIVETNALEKTHNGFSTVDCFMVLDNDPEVIELAVLKDLTLGNPETDWTGETKMKVMERIAGYIIRYPQAIYIGKGI